MIDFLVSERFEHPPQRVMDALTDLDRLRSWLPELVKLEPRSGEGFGPGTAWLETRNLFGQEATEHVTVAELEHPVRLVLAVDGEQGTARRGEYRFTWTLEPHEGGTRVSLRGEGEGLGTVGRVAGRFLVEPFRRAARRDVRALRRWLDEGRGGGG